VTDSEAAQKAIDAVLIGKSAFCKFLSANDSGESKSHQAGIYIPKTSIPILFDEPGKKGELKERWVKIGWQDGTIVTDTRFIYYGQKTRDEYRITNFGKGFPYIRPAYTGALFILVKTDPEDYRAFILNTDDSIQMFLNTFGMTPAETNRMISTDKVGADMREQAEIDHFIQNLKEDFPASENMSAEARLLTYQRLAGKKMVITDPDRILIEWTDDEYKLFRAIENARYGAKVQKGFTSVDSFVVLANKVLNRRKSRAGKSLEHHLAEIFDKNHIAYTPQATTEGNKKPDFIFPSEEAYHDASFSIEKLCSLAAKTTCKDRWRQILNEGDRFRDRTKYLCTMQQGISSAQMDEMEAENVVLVVPKEYIPSYPRDHRDQIWTIAKFIDFVREMENN
jgi:hypothetical protein